MQLTQHQLAETIKNVKGTTFAELVTVTTPVLDGGKGNPMQGRVRTHTVQNVQIGANYQNGVNRQLGREGHEDAGTFVPQPLAWGTWLVTNKIKQHTNKAGEYKLYLRYTVQPHMKPEVTYTFDGAPIEKGDIQGLRKSRKPHTQVEVERDIKPRDVAFENIRSIKIDGTLYHIV